MTANGYPLQSFSSVQIPHHGSRRTMRSVLEQAAWSAQSLMSIPEQWVVIGHTKRCQNSSDPVSQTDAL